MPTYPDAARAAAELGHGAGALRLAAHGVAAIQGLPTAHVAPRHPVPLLSVLAFLLSSRFSGWVSL